MSSPTLQIAIIGSGIAGLGTAISLKHRSNINVQIYERATELREIGASIALGPNGMRTLERLGVFDALDDRIAIRNTQTRYPMIYRHWATDEIVSHDEHAGEVEYRHLTARYYRPHLQRALLGHVEKGIIRLGKTFQSVHFDKGAQKLAITFTDGEVVRADILLGADGIHSSVRTFYEPGSSTYRSGGIFFRSAFPVSHLAHIPDLPDEATHVWGPDRTLFVSHLGEGLVTVVGSFQVDFEQSDAQYKDAPWNAEGDIEVFRKQYRDWSPLWRSIVNATPYVRIYPNATARGLETWTLGPDRRVTLAGDAAHAHGGAFAAGGSLALDDAWAFAQSIEHYFPEDAERLPTGQEIEAALRVYEHTRKPHTDRVLRTARGGQLKALERVRRKVAESDEELRARMKSRESPSWLHEHDVTKAFEATLKLDGEKDTDADGDSSGEGSAAESPLMGSSAAGKKPPVPSERDSESIGVQGATAQIF
jgi:salicylate hydroxylase